MAVIPCKLLAPRLEGNFNLLVRHHRLVQVDVPFCQMDLVFLLRASSCQMSAWIKEHLEVIFLWLPYL